MSVNSTRIRALRIAATLLAIGFLAGCSGSDDNATSASAPQDNSPGATAASDADNAPPATMAKSEAVAPKQASKPLPEGYPADVVPLYEPSTVTVAMKMGSGRSLKYMIIVETTDSVAVVAKSLADHYKAQGVKINQAPLNEEGLGQMVASKGGYGIMMIYGSGDKPGTTNITYDVTPQRGRH